MDARTRAGLTQALRRQRAALLKQFFDAEADLRSLAEDGEAELEERAQEERAARVLAASTIAARTSWYDRHGSYR
jgi:vacuolar-type H+-ATPase subunit D/Vma8